MIRQLEQAKTREEFLEILQEEKEVMDWQEVIRMSRSVNSNVREWARIMGYHNWGEGECNCSNCQN